ncbi:hypothetical protein [Nonomuraea sp. JJY05]|uniref:hypothetical protein n=1 Tax=Nonomuraea sp. JJY05 TaxID=3350255 RepID=UPI00373E48A9
MNTSPGEGGKDLARVWGVLAQVVTPTTVVAAILMYFGAVRTNTLYGRLGVDQSMLGLSIQDYVLRSVPLTVEPLIILLSAAVIAVPAHAWLIRSVTGHRTATTWTVAVTGVIGAATATWGVLGMAGLVGTPPVATPLCLGLGAFVLAYTACLYVRLNPRHTLPRTSQVAWRTVFVAFLVVPLLWSVADFAKLQGKQEADDYWAGLGKLPATVIYAPRRLYLEGPGITETALPDPNAMFRYKYTGLRLLIHSNGQYFLLPACWATSPQARAMALPADDSLRIEIFLLKQTPACA